MPPKKAKDSKVLQRMLKERRAKKAGGSAPRQEPEPQAIRKPKSTVETLQAKVRGKQAKAKVEKRKSNY